MIDKLLKHKNIFDTKKILYIITGIFFILLLFIFLGQIQRPTQKKIIEELANIDLIEEVKNINKQNNIDIFIPKTRIAVNFKELKTYDQQKTMFAIYKFKPVDIESQEFYKHISDLTGLTKTETVDTPAQGRIVKFKPINNNLDTGAILYTKERILEYYDYNDQNKIDKSDINIDPIKICETFTKKFEGKIGDFSYYNITESVGKTHSEALTNYKILDQVEKKFKVIYHNKIDEIEIAKNINNLLPNEINCSVDNYGKIEYIKFNISGYVLSKTDEIRIKSFEEVKSDIIANKLVLTDIKDTWPDQKLENVYLLNYKLVYIRFGDYLIPSYVINGLIDSNQPSQRVSVRFYLNAIPDEYFYIDINEKN